MNELLRVGDRLKYLRKCLDLSQREFSKKAAIDRTSLGKAETGEQDPSFQIITKIGITYNVSLDWICFGKGEIFIDSNINENIKIIDKQLLEALEDLEFTRWIKKFASLPTEIQKHLIKICNDHILTYEKSRGN